MNSIMKEFKNRLGIFFFKLFCPREYANWAEYKEEMEWRMQFAEEYGYDPG